MPDVAWTPFEPGTVLAGKYRVDRILAAGGQGTVAKAFHLRLRQPVAIKFPHRSGGSDHESNERLFREARATFRLRSEHIARIIDVDEMNGAPFIVMEYLDGIDLKDMLTERGPLPWAEAVGLLLQTIDGLAHAHDTGIVHRDLKPSNLFVERRADGTPLLKVLDFGVSKTTSRTFTSEEVGDLTEPLRMLGTPRYVAPEQAHDARSATTASDIWALGVIFQEMLTAEPVFRGRTEVEVLAQILHKWPAPVSLVRSDVPLEIERLILRCLQKAPEHRFADVRELAEHLAQFAPPWAAVNLERLRHSSRTSRPRPNTQGLPSGASTKRDSKPGGSRVMVAALVAVLLAATAALAAVELTKVHVGGSASRKLADAAPSAPQQATKPVVEILETMRPESVPSGAPASIPPEPAELAQAAKEALVRLQAPPTAPVKRVGPSVRARASRRLSVAATGGGRGTRGVSAKPTPLASSAGVVAPSVPSQPSGPMEIEKTDVSLRRTSLVELRRRETLAAETEDPLDGRK